MLDPAPRPVRITDRPAVGCHRLDPQESPLSQIAIECSPVDGGWLACVTVTDHGTSRDFEVAISDEELRHLEPGSADPAMLVRRSFEFLLAREPKESILSSFGLSVIGRYFPEYEREIRRR